MQGTNKHIGVKPLLCTLAKVSVKQVVNEKKNAIPDFVTMDI